MLVARSISHTSPGTQRPAKSDPSGRRRLESRLLRSLSGEVRFDRFARGLYSTDASIYEAVPTGVVFPRSVEDVRRTIDIAGESGVAIVPRGAGTSQSGQSIGSGLILDTSRHLHGVIDFDSEGRRIVVRPGIVLDDLNAFLRPYGLFFPIDVATSSRATLGGMAGNNSAGARSIRYGHMVEHVRAIDAVLADGQTTSFGSRPSERPASMGAATPPPAHLVRAVEALYEREAEELARRVPKVPRHVAGYALHRMGAEAPRLSDLLVGSEGTLAFFTALELDLQPIPPVRVLAVCVFESIGTALAAVPAIVDVEPTAVELVDRTLLGLAAKIPTFRATLDRLSGDHAADALGDILVVEFAGEHLEDVRRSMTALEEVVSETATRVVRAEAAELQGRIWGLRKAGLNISMSMKSSRKPLAFIEDCTIPLTHLPEWHERLSKIIARHSTHAIWYAHASVGCLHVRPALDLNDGEDLLRLRAIAEETFALASELGGSHSGEHGDGWIRSEFLEPMLGARLVRAFEEIKHCFDPEARLNPGKIVHAPRMDDASLIRFRPPAGRNLPTRLDWTAWGGFDQAVGMCNNNGTCRKRDAGVMCPSFRATADERDSTRGRANALRLALSGQLDDDGWDSPELYRAMDLCIGCKGCKRECPTGVDMARLKIEYLARYRERHPLSARERALAYLPRIAPLASRLPRLLNARNRSPALARLVDRTLGLAADRALPTWANPRFKWPTALPTRTGPPRGDLVLFVDTFTRHFEPENAYAAIRVLTTAGYRVRAPGQSGRPLCCGRTFLNVGALDEARSELERTTQALAPYAQRGVPIVGLEPSCLLTLRDELPALCPGELTQSVVDGALLFSELLVRSGALVDLPVSPLPVSRVRVHGHCHEKAFGVEGRTIDVLRTIPDLKVEPISAGCCGMAGSFGYESEHADVSRRIAELEILPSVREMGDDEWLVANGTSCRHQVADLAQRRARHVATVLDASVAHD